MHDAISIPRSVRSVIFDFLNETRTADLLRETLVLPAVLDRLDRAGLECQATQPFARWLRREAASVHRRRMRGFRE